MALISSASSFWRASWSGVGSGRKGSALPLPAVESLLGDGVEEGEELVELLLRDRIVLVAVAARAAHGQAHPGGGRGFDAVDHVFDQILFGNRAALEVDHVVAIETGGDLVVRGGVGQQVAGELLDREAVERHVVVEGADHPVAPGPHVAMAVDVIAVGVGVAGEVEPLHGHALAVVRRGEQAVDLLLVGVGRFVGEEGVDFVRSRAAGR